STRSAKTTSSKSCTRNARKPSHNKTVPASRVRIDSLRVKVINAVAASQLLVQRQKSAPTSSCAHPVTPKGVQRALHHFLLLTSYLFTLYLTSHRALSLSKGGP